MTTTHQYLDKYPISVDSEKLIVGTIHPHDHDNFTVPFFYGNVTSIWKLLSEAFPIDLQRPLTLDGILKFLKGKKISVSDTIRKCDRKNLTALDKDLIPIELNKQIKDDIRKSKISEILFTGDSMVVDHFISFISDHYFSRCQTIHSTMIWPSQALTFSYLYKNTKWWPWNNFQWSHSHEKKWSRVAKSPQEHL